VKPPARNLAVIVAAVGPGTTFALPGPNGAGKTTAVRILSTVIRADAGEVRVAGHDLAVAPHLVRARRPPSSSRPTPAACGDGWTSHDAGGRAEDHLS
jgi:ABC-type glutathione transport system ATPase component